MPTQTVGGYQVVNDTNAGLISDANLLYQSSALAGYVRPETIGAGGNQFLPSLARQQYDAGLAFDQAQAQNQAQATANQWQLGVAEQNRLALGQAAQAAAAQRQNEIAAYGAQSSAALGQGGLAADIYRAQVQAQIAQGQLANDAYGTQAQVALGMRGQDVSAFSAQAQANAAQNQNLTNIYGQQVQAALGQGSLQQDAYRTQVQAALGQGQNAIAGYSAQQNALANQAQTGAQLYGYQSQAQAAAANNAVQAYSAQQTAQNQAQANAIQGYAAEQQARLGYYNADIGAWEAQQMAQLGYRNSDIAAYQAQQQAQLGWRNSDISAYAAELAARQGLRTNDIAQYEVEQQARTANLQLLAGLRGPANALAYNYMLNQVNVPGGTGATPQNQGVSGANAYTVGAAPGGTGYQVPAPPGGFGHQVGAPPTGGYSVPSAPQGPTVGQAPAPYTPMAAPNLSYAVGAPPSTPNMPSAPSSQINMPSAPNFGAAPQLNLSPINLPQAPSSQLNLPSAPSMPSMPSLAGYSGGGGGSFSMPSQMPSVPGFNFGGQGGLPSYLQNSGNTGQATQAGPNPLISGSGPGGVVPPTTGARQPAPAPAAVTPNAPHQPSEPESGYQPQYDQQISAVQAQAVADRAEQLYNPGPGQQDYTFSIDASGSLIATPMAARGTQVQNGQAPGSGPLQPAPEHMQQAQEAMGLAGPEALTSPSTGKRMTPEDLAGFVQVTQVAPQLREQWLSKRGYLGAGPGVRSGPSTGSGQVAMVGAGEAGPELVTGKDFKITPLTQPPAQGYAATGFSTRPAVGTDLFGLQPPVMAQWPGGPLPEGIQIGGPQLGSGGGRAPGGLVQPTAPPPGLNLGVPDRAQIGLPPMAPPRALPSQSRNTRLGVKPPMMSARNWAVLQARRGQPQAWAANGANVIGGVLQDDDDEGNPFGVAPTAVTPLSQPVGAATSLQSSAPGQGLVQPTASPSPLPGQQQGGLVQAANAGLLGTPSALGVRPFVSAGADAAGAMSWDQFGQEQIAALPILQKLIGTRPSPAFWGAGLDTRIPGTAMQLPTMLNMSRYSRALPSEQELISSVYETPTSMGGLGLDMRDILALSARGSPMGSGYSPLNSYGR